MKGGSADAASRSSGGSKLGKIVEAPLRALCRARDMYVSGMTGLASRRGVAGYPAGVPGSYRFHGLPRSGSSSSSSSSGEDDLRELVRAASQLAVGGSPGPGGRAVSGSAVVPRSQSVGMARIDEDGPCDFGGDAVVVVPACPRSRSCEVPKRGWE